jgi:hypothetical protein
MSLGILQLRKSQSSDGGEMCHEAVKPTLTPFSCSLLMVAYPRNEPSGYRLARRFVRGKDHVWRILSSATYYRSTARSTGNPDDCAESGSFAGYNTAIRMLLSHNSMHTPSRLMVTTRQQNLFARRRWSALGTGYTPAMSCVLVFANPKYLQYRL